jgi:hypothetical protein
MEKTNSNKLLWIAFLLAAMLLSCSLPSGLSLLTQTTDQNPTGSVATTTLQETQTVTPTDTMPTAVPSPMSTLAAPNAPTWSAYNYTCEFTVGGGTMTMHLAWNDRSNSEDGYKVYRDQQVIATLPPNSTSYVDVAFVATGKTLSYSVEAFNKDWQVSGNTIAYGCQ